MARPKRPNCMRKGCKKKALGIVMKPLPIFFKYRPKTFDDVVIVDVCAEHANEVTREIPGTRFYSYPRVKASHKLTTFDNLKRRLQREIMSASREIDGVLKALAEVLEKANNNNLKGAKNGRNRGVKA